MATLIIQSADATSPDRVMRVEGKVVYIGRSPKCTVQLHDPTVSRLHAALARQADGSWALIRHKAAQAVWIDGEAVDKKPLRGGESIRIGGFTLLFHAQHANVAGVDDETVRGQPLAAMTADLPEATLWFEAGGPPAGSVPLSRVVTVFGRGEECDVVLDDQRCSRRHMEISRVGEAFVLRDLGSTNGVLVNGERASGEVDLVSGDVIQVGSARMRFELDDEAEPATMPAAVAVPVDNAVTYAVPPLPAASAEKPEGQNQKPEATGPLHTWVRATPFVQVSSALAAALLLSGLFFIGMMLAGRPRMEPSVTRAPPAQRSEKVAVKKETRAAAVPEEQEAADETPEDSVEQSAPAPAASAEPEPDTAAPAENELAETESDGDPLEEDGRPSQPRTSEVDRSFADLVVRDNQPEQAEEPAEDRGEQEDGVESPRAAAAAGATRLAVPDEADVAAALANIKEVYAEDLAGSRPLGPTLSKLLSAARKSAKPASKYALLVAAEEKAVQAREFAEAIDVIDQRAEMFECDALQSRLDMLREASRTAGDATDEIYDLAATVAGDAIEAERFDLATKAAALAGHVATVLDQQSPVEPVRGPFDPSATGPGQARPSAKPVGVADVSRKAESAKQLRLAVSECKKLHQKYDQARAEIEKTPDDQQAHEAVGKYLCFVRGDWQGGLRALADGDEGVLRSLAERELALLLDGGADPAKVFALAGDWWALADAPRRSSDLPASAVATVKNHAAGIYERILDKITDPIEAELAKKRIAVAADESPPWRVEPRSRDEL
jgi:pSer/pThr/pTyr-binding forkhead associated (FHA) protein